MAQRTLMMLANEYRPDPRVRTEALALKESGREVEVISWDRSGRRPRAEDDAGIRVRRVGSSKVQGPLRTFLCMPMAWLRMWRASSESQADVVHAHDLDALLPGILAAWSKDVPLIYDAHEWYSKMVARDLPFARLWIDIAEGFLLRRVDAVVTVNAALQARFRACGRDATVVMNTPPLGTVREAPPSNDLRLFYGGSLEPGRYVIEMMDALSAAEGWTMSLAGYGRLEDEVRRRAAADGRLRFLGWIDRDSIMAEMAAADVILCPLDADNENYRIATPNRLLEAMAAGRPVIATEGTLAGEMAREMDCGLAIEWSEAAFRTAVDQLRDASLRRRLGGNGRRAAEAEYNWEAMRRRLIGTYDSVLASAAAGSERR
jgi:glycosyltransferase involved in cell wall biosynthesis